MSRTTRREISRQHRAIDLQRPMLDGKLYYQVVCACGQRSLIGSRALAETDQKQHKYAVMLKILMSEEREKE